MFDALFETVRLQTKEKMTAWAYPKTSRDVTVVLISKTLAKQHST